MNLYNLFETPIKNAPKVNASVTSNAGVMPNQDQASLSPVGSGTSEWESKKKPVTMMGVGNKNVVGEARDVQLDELSNVVLGDYKKAAGADARAADKAGDFKRGDKRFKGIVRATVKQGDNDAKKHKELGVAEGSEEQEATQQIFKSHNPESIKKWVADAEAQGWTVKSSRTFPSGQIKVIMVKKQGVAEGQEQTPDQVRQTLNAWMNQDQQFKDPTQRAPFQCFLDTGNGR